ncbi:MAG TPA: methylenetetrahydromethanopterin dehydrogenase [Pirellulaceae bacterium]|nr:methylenetetrahydromethanopterin dehydrogenase [Pirellulaceae bacterium]HMO91548.1 methylenetetrahydromethanopterin dehydrogenase [Pirellulaceae bacterium]HMP68245.1 methylenetetrahydromethanopterin dehydrogenase [Pirellulaceae bacterium]
MSQKNKILLQLDVDPVPSSFDAIVALDNGVDRLLSYGAIAEEQVESLVHGAIFTRKSDDLNRTAVFIGGSNLEKCEQVLARALASMFGPMRVSVMFDPSGANTTAVAAIAAVERDGALNASDIAVFGGSGSVGSRICRLLALNGKTVHIVSRTRQKAEYTRDVLQSMVPAARIVPIALTDPEQVAVVLASVGGVFAAGAAGNQLISKQQLEAAQHLDFAVDLNAVPPAGIESIALSATGTCVGNLRTYGPIGIGGLKMKIHARCIATLFESNDHVLDLAEIYEIGRLILDTQT